MEPVYHDVVTTSTTLHLFSMTNTVTIPQAVAYDGTQLVIRFPSFDGLPYQLADATMSVFRDLYPALYTRGKMRTLPKSVHSPSLGLTLVHWCTLYGAMLYTSVAQYDGGVTTDTKPMAVAPEYVMADYLEMYRHEVAQELHQSIMHLRRPRLVLPLADAELLPHPLLYAIEASTARHWAVSRTKY